MMPMTEQLLLVTDRLCAKTGKTRGAYSTRIFNDGGRLDGIAAGKDLNTRSFERAMAWFSANWPADLAWPEGIARPVASAAPAPRPLRADERLEA